jgi:energy-coupling factor transporter ATP-binding protein EcfA2
MKIKSIWAKNAASLVDAKIEISVNGLSCFSSPNESGKSTLARVPYLIRKYKYKTNDNEIESLRNINNSGEPLVLGMEFIVGEKHYWIEKTFLTSSKAVFRQTAPVNEQFENTAAENQLQAVLSAIDPVLSEMLNLEQGKSVWLESKGDKSRTDTLSLLLDQATQPETDQAEDGFFIDLEKRYLQFFTPGGVSSTKASTKGSELKSLVDSRQLLWKKNEEFESTLKRIEGLSENLDAQPDLDEISGIFECQKRQSDFLRLKAIKAEFDVANERLTLNPIEVPANWTEDLHQALEDTFASFTAISSQGTLSITALKDFNLKDEDGNPNLSAGEAQEYPLARSKKYIISDIAEISVKSGSINDETYGEYKKHLAVLASIGVETLKQSREIQTKWSLNKEVDKLTDKYGTLELIISEISALELYKSQHEVFWEKALISEPVTIDQAMTTTKARTEISTQIDSLIDSDEADKYSVRLAQLADIEKRIGKLELERKTLDLIYRTVQSSRQNTRSRLAPNFQRVINSLIDDIYEDGFSVSIGDDLAISSRTKGNTTLNTGRLSVGAKETLAILLRMAICRLADSAEPLPLILDDEFAYMDDTNIAAFIEYLKQVKDQQIILLTHQPEKFKALEFIQI